MKSKRMRILDENNRNLLYADKDKLEINVKGVEFVGKFIFHARFKEPCILTLACPIQLGPKKWSLVPDITRRCDAKCA